MAQPSSDNLTKSPSENTDKNWRDLAEVTLAQLTLFNSWRGEMQWITVNDYKQGTTSEAVQEEILESLSEKHLAKTQ